MKLINSFKNRNRRNFQEAGRFLVAGVIAFTTDMLVYFMLLKFITHSPAKALSFILASVVAYLLNKYWTFNLKEKSLMQVFNFTLLNTSTLGANVAVNKITLFILPYQVVLAFLCASGTSTVLNFLGQKFWVFKKGVQ